MGDHKEVRHERLYVKVPGTDKLRKNAAGRLRHLLATGWRETERTQSADYIRVRVERTGHVPQPVKLKEGPAIQTRERRGGFGGDRRFGGPGGPRGGGPGGPRGGPGGPPGAGGGPR